MCYMIFEINNFEEKDIFTFITFNIATARSKGYSLLKFVYADDVSEKLNKQFISKLKTLKKQGTIDCYAFSQDFSNGEREADYILNKYPELADEFTLENDISIFVKL